MTTKLKFTLKNKSIFIEDTGVYECNAMNSRGRAATTTKLNVLNMLPPARTTTNLAALVPAHPSPVIGPLVPNYPPPVLSSSIRTAMAGQYCKMRPGPEKRRTKMTMFLIVKWRLRRGVTLRTSRVFR